MFPGSMRVLLDPDTEYQGGTVSTQVETANPTVDSGQSQDIPSMEQPRVPAGTTTSAADQPAQPVGQVAQQPNGGWTSIREAARNYGVDLSSFQDDASALAYLAQQANSARQANYYAQLGQQLAPHAQGIRSYLEQQQAPQQPAQPERQPWEAPTIDQRYFQLVERDPQTGIILPRHPSVPAEIVKAVTDYVNWHEQFQQNPAAAIQPLVESRAQQLARETVQEELRQQQQAATVRSILERNAQWMYATDEQGRQLRNPDGSLVPSTFGARYIYHLRSLANSGMTDPAQQDHYARQMVRNEILSQVAQQQGQVQVSGQQAAAVVPQQQRRVRASGHPQRNTAQAAGPARQADVPGGTAPDESGKSLQQRLREALARDGVSAGDMAASPV